MIIFASSLGTVFEWYDFYLYGLLATIITAQFFSGVNETTGFIFALAAFAAGFAVRPFGALFFGRIGDLVGRIDLPRRLAAKLCLGRRRRADRAGRAPTAAGPCARRRIWRRCNLRRRACPRGQTRFLHQLHPDHREARPVRRAARANGAICGSSSSRWWGRSRARPWSGTLFFLGKTLEVGGATTNILTAIALALATPTFVGFLPR